MSFRASAVAQAGGFDRNTNLLEDTDFSVRVAKEGWLLMFEPGAELVHLSASSGGVRGSDPMKTEFTRFSSTAYYILKHRGVPGALPFIATFTLIALSRAFRHRSLKAFTGCMKAIFDGFALARSGADQLIIPADRSKPTQRNASPGGNPILSSDYATCCLDIYLWGSIGTGVVEVDIG